MSEERTLLRRLVAAAVILGAILTGGLVFAASASAHATLVSSSPEDGSRLKTVPTTVTISFDEQVGLGSLGYLHVTNQAGQRVDAGAAFHPSGDGTKVADTLKSGLGDGTYTESYRVISADSHPVAGVVRFVVGNGVLSAASVSASTTDRGVSSTFAIVRWISFAGFAMLGAAWLLLTVWPQGRDDRRARAIVWTGWIGTAIGAVLELLLEGPYAAGSGLSTALRPSLIDATLHTDYGQYHCARLLILGVLAVLLGTALQAGRTRSRFEDAVWPLGVGIAVTFSAVGHADTTNPSWLSITADVIHLTAMAAWVGGLVLLLGAVLPRREPDELKAVLPVFSRVAFASVVALAVTGTYAAWRGVGTIHAILSTNYGLLVSAKVLLFCALVAVGNLSRHAVQRRMGRVPVAYAMTDAALDEAVAVADEDAPDVEVERLRRSVIVEIGLAVLVLVATAVLITQPRGKEAIAANQRQPVSATAQLGGGRTVTVTVDPGTHGSVTTAVALSPGSEPQQITATASLPAKELGPIPITLTANGKDLYGASGTDLPVAGNWVIALVVTFSDFDAISTDVTIHLY